MQEREKDRWKIKEYPGVGVEMKVVVGASEKTRKGRSCVFLVMDRLRSVRDSTGLTF